VVNKDGGGRSAFFSIVDGNVGIYCELSAGLVANFALGDLIEVEGVSNPGKFAPYLDAHAVRNLGKGMIPEPRVASRDELLSGQLDAQWIEVSGVVRRVKSVENDLDLEVDLETGGGRMLVHVSGGSLTIPVDSTVRLRGVCYYQFNKTRQALSPFLSVPAANLVFVSALATTNLDTLPVCSVENLMQFSPVQSYVHRVRVRGAVIHSQPGEDFWIRDGGRGLHVVCDGPEPLEVGAEVDVFGFLSRGEYGPMVEDAVFRKTGKTLPVPPIHLMKADEALDHDSDLVECAAIIQEQWSALDGCRLKLSDGTTEFSAVLRLTNHNAFPSHWLPGARVRVAGICAVSFLTKPLDPGTLEPQHFQILLRSLADVVVLQAPSWWTAEHVGWLTASVMGLLLAIGGSFFWIHRRRAARQMAAMKAQAALEAERTRIARDLHDEIGANLTHISILSTLASQAVSEQSQGARQHCVEAAQVAQQTVRAFDEILWSVNPKNDTLHSLSHYICRYAEENMAPAGIACRFELDDSFPNLLLLPNCRHSLLLAVKEVLHNVIKHARARRVEIKCGMETNRVFLVRLSDDGRGMDSRAGVSSPAAREGQGMENLRRRLTELGGTCVIESQSGQGTQVTFRLPL
jgi:signal transduction histidine kinase